MNVGQLIQKVKDLFSGGVGPDVLLMKEGVDAVSKVLSLFLGIIVYAIIVGIPVITAFDILYLTVPALRNKYLSDHDGDETKVRLVSKDAVDALRKSFETGGEVHALNYYLKKRTWTYILVGCTLFLVSTGMWNIVVEWCIGICSVFVAWIQSW